MFKNKKSIYIILPIFLLVWAFVGYRVYSLFFSPDKRINPAIYYQSSKKVGEGEKKYEPKFNYQDPFLGVAKKRYIKIEKNVEQVKVEVKPDEVVTKPNFYYIGVISSTNDSKQAIVKFNNQTRIVQIGDSLSFCKVVNIDSDSIMVTSGKHKWSYIFLNNPN